MKAQDKHLCSAAACSDKAVRGPKSKLRTRLGLATMFVFSMGIMPAPSHANPQQQNCKRDDCAGEVQGQIERDAEELARNAEKLATSVATATRELMEDFVGRVSDMVRGMPTYEEPEVNENGDIIIRRKPSVDDQADGRLL